MSSPRPLRAGRARASALRLLAALLALLAPAAAAAQAGRAPDVEIFVQEGCPHCEAAEPFIGRLRGRADLEVRLHDVKRDAAARRRLVAIADSQGIAALGTPTFLVRGAVIVGWESEGTTGRAILDRLAGRADAATAGGATCATEPDATGEIAPCVAAPAAAPASAIGGTAVRVPVVGDVSAADLGLPLFSIVLGLLDGFNPCAMWTLLYLLALLATLGSRKKMAVIGGTFIGVGGLLYFAVMAAWLQAFIFIGVTRPVQMVLGGLALLVGAINVKDHFAFKKGISLSIPDAAKPKIYQQTRRILSADNLPAAIVAVAVLALMVNLFEMLCTAGFPAVFTQVLAANDLSRAEHFGYLAIYNVGYIFDDSVMLAIAVTTLSRRRLQEREGRFLKLVSGVVMLAMGLLLVLKPEWLT